MIAILVLFLGLHISGMFDLIVSRIMDRLATGNLLTARNSSFETLMLKGIIDFKMMGGYAFKYGDVAWLWHWNIYFYNSHSFVKLYLLLFNI